MKKLMLLLLIVFCGTTLMACQSLNKELRLFDNVSKISISNSNGYGGLNENYFDSIDQTEEVASFGNILKNTNVIYQKVDVKNEKPDYDILVQYENGDTHGLHLVFDNEREESIVTFIGHEEVVYIISSQDTIRLKELLVVE
ncbi:hypothetical protein D8M04_03870 [Oceanobacillus piezotolerans]|uniref:Lipoprotein n=1 Tax=Oceanobacillus piezotolerans TaxID=2448030 RepID=A0A498DGU1_9BACI|nr:hypothetical protein [Oceanobacillus piezotolerans]RLL48408.1 hypothetical protein D8M04_03870 [Oceanobacillus piezotolerans]